MPEAQSAPDERVTVRLTVAAVAERLGVAASTLRTWERRYGLGPAMRTAGRHRRYSAEDVDRLEAMRRLTRDGVAPADAARAARGLDPDDESVAEVTGHADEVLDPLSMAAAAVEADEQRLHRMLGRAVRQSEGLSAWHNLVRPALDLLEARDHGDRPGRDPVSVLGAALLAALRSVAPEPGAEAPVMIHADHDHHLDAHVLATELAVHGVQARVLRPARRKRDADSAGAAAAPHVQLAVLLGNPRDGSAVVQAMRDSGRTAFVISLTGVPREFADLPRARTLAGAVHEIADLLSEPSARAAAGARR